MDPITQGALGAALPQAATRSMRFRDKAVTITWVGALAGMSPDLDVLIQSPTDPLLFLEFHRQFTHSLFFIPIGALICSLVFYPFAKRHLAYPTIYLVCLLGYGTHSSLDACTTYGTQLLWPLANERFAWHTIAVVDPFATLPLLAMVITSMVKANPWFARAGLLWFGCYLIFGWVQRDRVIAAGEWLAESRGHAPILVSAKPGFANPILWKVVYEYDNHFYVDAVRASTEISLYPGESIPRLNIERDLPWLDLNSKQANDLERFRWFSMDYVALDRTRPNFVIDTRYSMLPNEIRPLWGIGLSPTADPEAHVTFESDRDATPERLDKFWQMLKGEGCIPTALDRHSPYILCAN